MHNNSQLRIMIFALAKKHLIAHDHFTDALFFSVDAQKMLQRFILLFSYSVGKIVCKFWKKTYNLKHNLARFSEKTSKFLRVNSSNSIRDNTVRALKDLLGILTDL